MATNAENDEYVAPASPAGYLMWHIVKKGFQAGGVIGAAAVVPVMFLWRKVRDPTALLNAMGYSALGVTAASATLGAIKFTSIDQAGFEDRAYRLHYNTSQNRTDAFSTAGALIGFAATAALLPRGGAAAAGAGRAAASYGMTLVGGAAVGCAAGVAVHVATKSAEMRTPNRALHELKRDD